MKNRLWTKWLIYTVCVCGMALSAQARKKEITLVLVPREEATTKLGVEIASRYPTLLISYKVAKNGALSLHGWTGSKWVNITHADYVSGNFFKKGPDSALVVEKEGVPAPEKLMPPVDWCTDVSKITTTELRPLIHLTGQYFDYNFKDWEWFAKRYRMSINAINPENLNVSWYHKRLDEHLKAGKQLGSDDLKYWVVVRQTVVEKSPDVEQGTPEAAEPGSEELHVFTNAVPPAVVMGAGDVPAETQDNLDNAAEEASPEAVVPEVKKDTPDSAE